MGKIRHIAIRCEGTERTAQWLQEAIELQLVQRRASGAIDLTDGDVNVTLLPMGLGVSPERARAGFDHIGVTVADDERARQRMPAAGATELNLVGLSPHGGGRAPCRCQQVAGHGLYGRVTLDRSVSPVQFNASPKWLIPVRITAAQPRSNALNDLEELMVGLARLVGKFGPSD